VNQIVLAAPVLPEIFIINVEKMAFPPAVFTPLTPAPPVSPAAIPREITHIMDAAETKTDYSYYALPLCLFLLLIAAIIGFVAQKKSTT
jgi:hypothetical protein